MSTNVKFSVPEATSIASQLVNGRLPTHAARVASGSSSSKGGKGYSALMWFVIAILAFIIAYAVSELYRVRQRLEKVAAASAALAESCTRDEEAESQKVTEAVRKQLENSIQKLEEQQAREDAELKLKQEKAQQEAEAQRQRAAQLETAAMQEREHQKSQELARQRFELAKQQHYQRMMAAQQRMSPDDVPRSSSATEWSSATEGTGKSEAATADKAPSPSPSPSPTVSVENDDGPFPFASMMGGMNRPISPDIASIMFMEGAPPFANPFMPAFPGLGIRLGMSGMPGFRMQPVQPMQSMQPVRPNSTNPSQPSSPEPSRATTSIEEIHEVAPSTPTSSETKVPETASSKTTTQEEKQETTTPTNVDAAPPPKRRGGRKPKTRDETGEVGVNVQEVKDTADNTPKPEVSAID